MNLIILKSINASECNYFSIIDISDETVCCDYSCTCADCSQNGLDHPSADISLDDGAGMLVDGFERTYDGKLKCRYCNYATRGTARLIEHIRIHTGKLE